jgi:hypothetical protein
MPYAIFAHVDNNRRIGTLIGKEITLGVWIDGVLLLIGSYT